MISKLLLVLALTLTSSLALARDYQRLEVAPIGGSGRSSNSYDNDSYATSNSRPSAIRDYYNQLNSKPSEESETHYKGATSDSKQVNDNGLIINKSEK